MSGGAIVVGGGILGVSTAWRLVHEGVDVTLLEAGDLGGGVSQASFSWFNASKKPPLAYHRLNVAGMNYYRRLWVELDEPRWLHFDGNIEWDATVEGPTRLRGKVQGLKKWGYEADLMPISELKDIEPSLVAPSHIEEFAYYSFEGYVNLIDMIGDIAAKARSMGARLLTNTVVDQLLTEGSRVTGVITRAGERLFGDTVVVCTGASAPELLKQVGFSMPMAPTTGMVAMTSPSTARLRAIHHSDGLNIRPDGAGRIMMRHYDFDDMVGPDDPEVPIPAFADQLLARAAKVLPELASTRIEGIRIASRPIPGDGKSVVGQVPGVDGLHLIVTHSGVTLGPLLGHITAREIVSTVRDSRLHDFRPDRKIQTVSEPILEN